MPSVHSCQVILNLTVVKQWMSEARIEAKSEGVSFVDVVAKKKIPQKDLKKKDQKEILLL